jgi:hypothetical protein
MDKKKYLPIFLTLFCLTLLQQASAQLSVSGQIRTRTEYRDGQGAPVAEVASPAIFTSQRSRLNVGYAGHRFKIYTSLQDVRVWGQDASMINRTTVDSNDGLMLHEAWAELSLVDTGKVVKNFTMKIGRQELVYDDVKLLGNLDWLQQARRHDAILFKFDHNGWMAHLGAAYNQNNEKKVGSTYVGTAPTGAPAGYGITTNGLGTMYKSMQFLYVGRKLHFGNASFLFFKDDFSKYTIDPNDPNKTPVYQKGVWSRYTFGANLFGTALRKITFGLSAFSQKGEYRDGTSLNEYLLSASAMYAVGRKVSVGPGVDLLSGNGEGKANQRFDPLYGTPHKFWGYMDYFYVADGFGSSNGLLNYYLKAKYKPKDNLTLTLDVHEFALPHKITNNDGESINKNLGTEVDFMLTYNMTKAITFEAGYSVMKSTDTMLSPKVKNPTNISVDSFDKTSTWAYLMISIKPAELIVKP